VTTTPTTYPRPPAADPRIEKLPHGPAFRFVSRIEALTPGQTGRGVWETAGDEPFYAGHFPDHPVVPGVLIGEALAQMAGLVGLADTDTDPETAADAAPVGGMLAQIDVRFHRPVSPPAEIQLHATLTRRVGPLTQFDVEATCGDQRIARGGLTLVRQTEPTP
jgi:3-hydroxymyristoyl/3-hydroxydecanoyl-(acyl carrier protein) dehydratase